MISQDIQEVWCSSKVCLSVCWTYLCSCGFSLSLQCSTLMWCIIYNCSSGSFYTQASTALPLPSPIQLSAESGWPGSLGALNKPNPFHILFVSPRKLTLTLQQRQWWFFFFICNISHRARECNIWYSGTCISGAVHTHGASSIDFTKRRIRVKVWARLPDLHTPSWGCPREECSAGLSQNIK